MDNELEQSEQNQGISRRAVILGAAAGGILVGIGAANKFLTPTNDLKNLAAKIEDETLAELDHRQVSIDISKDFADAKEKLIEQARINFESMTSAELARVRNIYKSLDPDEDENLNSIKTVIDILSGAANNEFAQEAIINLISLPLNKMLEQVAQHSELTSTANIRTQESLGIKWPKDMPLFPIQNALENYKVWFDELGNLQGEININSEILENEFRAALNINNLKPDLVQMAIQFGKLRFSYNIFELKMPELISQADSSGNILIYIDDQPIKEWKVMKVKDIEMLIPIGDTDKPLEFEVINLSEQQQIGNATLAESKKRTEMASRIRSQRLVEIEERLESREQLVNIKNINQRLKTTEPFGGEDRIQNIKNAFNFFRSFSRDFPETIFVMAAGNNSDFSGIESKDYPLNAIFVSAINRWPLAGFRNKALGLDNPNDVGATGSKDSLLYVEAQGDNSFLSSSEATASVCGGLRALVERTGLRGQKLLDILEDSLQTVNGSIHNKSDNALELETVKALDFKLLKKKIGELSKFAGLRKFLQET